MVSIIIWRRQWQPTPVLLPGKSHGQRNLVGYSSWSRVESDTTDRLRFHFSLSRIGEGNGNPFQRSCLENPRDRGAWWAAVYGAAQSWTRLKRLSSSRRDKEETLSNDECYTGKRETGDKEQLLGRKWHPTAVLLSGKSHGWRSLVGCSPWGC